MSKSELRRKAKAIREDLRALDVALTKNDLAEIETLRESIGAGALTLKHSLGRFIRIREA